MPLPPQTVALLKTARSLVGSLPADGVLLLAEGDMSFEEARRLLGSCKLMVAFTTDTPRQQPEDDANLIVLDIEGGPTPIQERMSLALLEAVRLEHLHPGADVVVLYNGIQVGLEEQGGIDSLTIGLARELAEEGIRVNTVTPGMVETEIHDRSTGDPARVERIRPLIPMKRIGKSFQASSSCAPAACAKIGGASPTKPMSMALSSTVWR